MISQIPQPNPDFQLEEMDGELLLYHPGKTVTIYLNETASLIWQLCDGNRNTDAIYTLLRESFPEVGSLEDDIKSTLGDFQHHGAIRLT